MWIDEPNAAERINKIADPVVRKAVLDLSVDGFCVLEGAVAPELCDRAMADFQAFCKANPEEARGAELSAGFHSRLYNLHAISEPCMEVSMTPIVLRILDEVFSARTALNSTLYFEQGSEQALHRDTPFFTAEPYRGEFAGVWYALEDVQPDAGPLIYVPGGHKLSVDVKAAIAAGGNDPAQVGKMFQSYNSQVQEVAAAHDLQTKTLLIKKGDVAIWHPELPHGGSAISRNNVSRNSLVAHYIPEGAYIQTVGYFFELEPQRKIMEFMNAGHGRLMRWNDKPVFMPNS